MPKFYVSVRRKDSSFYKKTSCLLLALDHLPCDHQTARLCSLTRDNSNKQTNKQTKLTFFGRLLFFSDNHLSNYTKTIIRLRLSKYL